MKKRTHDINLLFSSRSRRRGFTLVELLVVLAIVLVLAALLFPSLSSAHKSAQSAKCKAHLHQMGIAIHTYGAGWGVFPYSLDYSRGLIWYNALIPYFDSTQEILDCPAYKGQSGYFWNKSFLAYFGGSYGYNGFGSASAGYAYVSRRILGLGGDPSFGTPIRPQSIPIERVVAPSEMFAVGDSMVSITGTTGYLLTVVDAEREIPNRHPKGFNMLLVDGHTEATEHQKLALPKTDVRRRWNNDDLPHFTNKELEAMAEEEE